MSACSNLPSEAGFEFLVGRNPPIRRSERHSTDLRRCYGFSSRSRPSLHHLAWKCAIRRDRSSTATGANRPSSWLMLRGVQGSSTPKALAQSRSEACAAAQVPHADAAVQQQESSTHSSGVECPRPIRMGAAMLQRGRAGVGDVGALLQQQKGSSQLPLHSAHLLYTCPGKRRGEREGQT